MDWKITYLFGIIWLVNCNAENTKFTILNDHTQSGTYTSGRRWQHDVLVVSGFSGDSLELKEGLIRAFRNDVALKEGGLNQHRFYVVREHQPTFGEKLSGEPTSYLAQPHMEIDNIDHMLSFDIDLVDDSVVFTFGWTSYYEW